MVALAAVVALSPADAPTLAEGGLCPWDCADGDGNVGTVDLLSLLAAWGGTGDCNFDGGVVGTSDLLKLLANWGECFTCGEPGSGNCCVANGTPGCDSAGCCEVVCAADPLCCDAEWDSACAATAGVLCAICAGRPGCGDADAGDCCIPNGTPACNNFRCCDFVCNVVDPFCCDVAWDLTCVGHAETFCAICP